MKGFSQAYASSGQLKQARGNSVSWVFLDLLGTLQQLMAAASFPGSGWSRRRSAKPGGPLMKFHFSQGPLCSVHRIPERAFCVCSFQLPINRSVSDNWRQSRQKWFLTPTAPPRLLQARQESCTSVVLFFPPLTVIFLQQLEVLPGKQNAVKSARICMGMHE